MSLFLIHRARQSMDPFNLETLNLSSRKISLTIGVMNFFYFPFFLSLLLDFLL